MKRNVGSALLGAALLAALGGCAYQEPLQLPELGPPARSSAPSPFYSPYYGYGFSYGYGSGYRPGYDPYYNYSYGGADPRYYGPGVVYVPYPRYIPVPCADANGDGRCDKRPRGDGHDGDGDGHHGGHSGGQGNGGDDGTHDGVPAWPNSRDGGGPQVDGPRIRRGESADRYVAPGTTTRVAPAPVTLQPAPTPRAAPPPARPQQARPAEMPRRAAPPPPSDRGPRVGPNRGSAAGDDGPPSRRPD